MGDIADDIIENMFWEDEDSEDKEEIIQKSVESRWKRGNHKTKDGELVKISEMEMSHLCNTIKLFSHYNTKPLTDEIKKRLLNK